MWLPFDDAFSLSSIHFHGPIHLKTQKTHDSLFIFFQVSLTSSFISQRKLSSHYNLLYLDYVHTYNSNIPHFQVSCSWKRITKGDMSAYWKALGISAKFGDPGLAFWMRDSTTGLKEIMTRLGDGKIHVMVL